VAGGVQGLQVINTMDFSARSLRAWAVPYAVPSSRAAFEDSGAIEDELIELQLRALGEEVVRVAERFALDPRFTGRLSVKARPNASPRLADVAA
jgi:FMN reductase